MKNKPSNIKDKQYFNSALQQAFASIESNMAIIGDRLPKIGNQDHSWDYCDDGNWVAGFWPGQLWLTYKVLAKSKFRNAARMSNSYFTRLLNSPALQDHDLGFLFSLTSVADFKLTGDESAKLAGLRAADALMSRFRPVGKFIVAWNADHDLGPARTQGKTIIDSLQNVSLLFWATEVTGNDSYRKVALAHSETLSKHIVRPDFSTYHTFNFDPLTQLPVGGETFQGYADESCWSRGQSWAIHGFAQIAKYSGNEEYLTLAKKLADYAIKRLPANGVPLWDYDLPSGEPQYVDTSAAAITASGLILIGQMSEGEDSKHYQDWGKHILQGLIDDYALFENSQAQGLLAEGASYVNIDLCDNMLPYGDYYFLEGLMRANGYSEFFW